MRHLMKHHHSSVCQVLQLMPQLPITFPILVRHLTSVLRLIETIFSLLKVLESPYTYKRIYLWHYYKWELNLGHSSRKSKRKLFTAQARTLQHPPPRSGPGTGVCWRPPCWGQRWTPPASSRFVLRWKEFYYFALLHFFTKFGEGNLWKFRWHLYLLQLHNSTSIPIIFCTEEKY